MNASSVFEKRSLRAVCAVTVGLCWIATASAVFAVEIDHYLVTDAVDAPANGLADEERAIVARSVGAEEESEEIDRDASLVDRLSYEEQGSRCSSCSGRGCDECREPKGWFNKILCDVEPRFIGQVDALMLWQGSIPSRTLYSIVDGGTALDADQGQTPVSVGTRYGLQMNLDCTYAFEGNYFRVDGFEGEQSTPYSDGLYAMNNLAGLDYADIDWARFRTNGQIQSAEFNWRRKTDSPLTWLAGFRWVEWNQGLRVIDIYQGDGGPANDIINTQTGNDLYGGQVGADVMLWNRWKEVKVNGVGKAGIFYNQAYSRTSVPTELLPIDGDAVADQTAFFGEVGANASVKLTHWLSWRLGYSVFWLSGVATAVDQLERVGQAPPLERPRINTNGSVLLHGATTGLEARW